MTQKIWDREVIKLITLPMNTCSLSLVETKGNIHWIVFLLPAKPYLFSYVERKILNG